MPDSREVSRGLRSAFTRYLATVTLAGLVGTLVTAGHLRPDDFATMGPAFYLIAALLVASELRPLFTTGGDQNGVSISTTFVFALLLHWGLAAAVLMQAIATVIADRTNHKAWWRTAFNVAQYSLSYGAAAVVLAWFGRSASPGSPVHLGGSDLIAVILAGLAYFVVNDALVSRAIALHADRGFLSVLRSDLAFQGLTSGALLALSPLVVVVMERSLILVPLLLLPLFAVYKNASISREREYQALHDLLTGLPNRKQLLHLTEAALTDARRNEDQVGFFLLDLDRFKDVNDTLGHKVGDELLVHVGERIASVLRPEDTVARLGGDEFAVLLPTVRDVSSAEEVAARIRLALSEPFSLHDVSLDLDASVGIALYPDHAVEPEQLMQRADVAMYAAKETRNGVETYNADRDPHSPARLGLFGQLRRAIEVGELVLHYQPKFALPSGDVIGVEALVRWQHPEHGLIGPDLFIPIAEQTGLMRELTGYVLDKALEQAAIWAAEGDDLLMSVNVSARDLHDVRFVERVRASLMRAGVAPEMLELELTERVVMADPARALDNLTALANLGVRLSLDDFGTGYSSLAYLQRMPVAEIKIDKSFVLRLASEEDDETIVRSTIDLAHGLGLKVLAEGIETAEVWQRLVALGCDAAQGFYMSRPMPAADVADWLHAQPAPSRKAIRAVAGTRPRQTRRKRAATPA